MWPETSVLNLVDRVPVLQMPVFFFLARKDHFVPAETSVTYYDALTAPSKRLVWFDESGHELFADEPAKFNASMVRLVSPVVRQENAPLHGDRMAG
jgi:esterase/lipase